MEILARTQPRSVSFEPRGTIHGLTTEEVAAMLFGIHDGAFYLAMQFVCGGGYQKIITHYLYDNNLKKLSQSYRMSDSEAARGTKDRREGFLWQLTYLAVCEFISPDSCIYCGGGTGLQTQECTECGGSGTYRMTDGQRSQYLKTDRFDYWESLYNKICNVLDDYKAEARDVLKEQDIDL